MADNDKNDSDQDSSSTEDIAADTKTEDQPKKRASGGRLLLLLVAIAILAFVIFVVGSEYFSRDAPGGGDAKETSESAPTVGGPFELINHHGETVTDKDFRGQYMLIFFGYTYCPDICPTALSDMAAALEMLPEEKAKEVVPVFISVDPARDTPEHLSEYVTFFHPRTVGLTGSEEQVKAAAREYRVYYRKNEPKGDDPQNYLVDHTSITYLVGPDGKLVTHFPHGTTAEAMAERIGQLL